MLGKVLKPKKVVYYWSVWLVVITMMISITACGQDATPTPVAVIPTGPTPTNTPEPTSTPVPTATPTEIPIVLPTATPPNPLLPDTAPAFQQPLTAPATSTPRGTATANPTATLPPSATPYQPPKVDALGIYSLPWLAPQARLDYIPPPGFSTSCILAQHYFPITPGQTIGAAPTPPPTNFTVPPTPTSNQSGIGFGGNAGAVGITISPAGGVLAPDTADGWLRSFTQRYYTDQRRNLVTVIPPTFTPNPTGIPDTEAPAPTDTPAPIFNTPDVFTGLTPIPVNTAQGAPPTRAKPTPTVTPRVPTWTPSTANRFTSLNDPTTNFIRSIYISDVTALMNKFTDQPLTLVVMWQVMNDVSLSLANPDIPEENYLRAYETSLDQIIQFTITRNRQDPRLGTTGEQRYANTKIIVGNVPDLTAFRYYAPCFTAQRLRQVQNNYNSMINRIAAKYPGVVYVADMNTLNWRSHPQWVAVEDGLSLSQTGSDAVADVFGRVFLSLKF